MIDRAQIDQIRQATDIVELVRDHVPGLVRSGRTFKGLCPFHGERTPSFHVNPELGVFKCFGCGEGGDAIAFVMKMEHLTFWEAASKLASKAGITLKMEGRGRTGLPESERSKLQRVLAEAARFYEQNLWNSPMGQTARDYLQKRGVNEKTAKEFKLGFAPASGDTALEQCLKIGFSIGELEKAGLVTKHTESGRFRDNMRGRLVFPIHDIFGAAVGFGGRILEETGKTPWNPEMRTAPKYLNSPDTVLFKKGSLLYGLPQAKVALSKNRQALIVEGYMDVIGCHQAGITSAVAPLGTALTSDHARLLKRYAQEIILFFDADLAGWEATERTFKILMGIDLFVRIAAHADERDADEILLQEGPAVFQRILDSAQEGLEMILKKRLERGSTLPLHDRIQVADEMVRTIAESPNDILKQEWIHKIGQRLSLEEDGLFRRLRTCERQIKKEGENKPSSTLPVAGSTSFSPEGEILQLLMFHPACWNLDGLSGPDFMDPRVAEIFDKMVSLHQQGGSFNGLLDHLTPAAQDYCSRLMTQEKTFSDAPAYFSSAVRRLKLQRIKRERLALEDQLREMMLGHLPSNPSVKDRYRDVLKELQRLDRGDSLPVRS